MFPFQDNILKKSSLICLPERQITSDPGKGRQNIKRPCRHFPPPLLVPSTVQQWPPVCLSAVQTLPLPSRAPANTAARRLLNNNLDFFWQHEIASRSFLASGCRAHLQFVSLREWSRADPERDVQSRERPEAGHSTCVATLQQQLLHTHHSHTCAALNKHSDHCPRHQFGRP